MQKKYKKLVALLLVMTMLTALFVPAASAHTRFSDASGHWAQKHIEQLEKEGILHGYPDGTVRPDKAVTQGEYAAMLAYMTGFEPETDKQESTESSWDRKYAAALSKEGIIAAQDNYESNVPISRMELIAWTVRAMGGEELAEKNTSDCRFPDADGLTDMQKGYLAVAADSGLIFGYPDGTIRPDASCTRAETFAILCRFANACEYVEEKLQPSVPSGTVPPQMVVTLDGPERAETYEPVEIKAIHKNMKSLTWEVTGTQGETPLDSASYESNLDENGGEITFFNAGHYSLKAVACSNSGQESIYILGIEVTDAPIRLSAGEETALYNDFGIAAFVRGDVTELSWNVTRDGDALMNEGYIGSLGDLGGTISFMQDGIYKFTLSGKDGLGNPVSGSCNVLAYQTFQNALYGPAVSYVGSEAYYSSSHFWLVEGATAKWQVLENGKQLDWDSVLDGEMENYTGGTVKFLRAGQFTIRLEVTDRLGHVTNMDAETKVYDSVEYSIEAPEVAYSGETVKITVSGLDDSFAPVEWTVNGLQAEVCDLVDTGGNPLDYSGGELALCTPGTYTLGLTISHSSGNKISKHKNIQVYPIVGVNLFMENTACVGDQISIQGSYDFNEDNLVPEWSLEKDGQEVKEAEYITGSLEDGLVSFRQPGEYTVTTWVTDALNRRFSASRTITVEAAPELPEPEFTVPEISYVGMDIPIAFINDIDGCSIRWSYASDNGENGEDLITGSLDSKGGTLIANKAGSYTLDVTVEDGRGNSKTVNRVLTVKDKPHIRMNPLSKETNEERFDYVYILHIGTSGTYYPTFTNTAGMTVTFEFLENGEIAGEDAAYFEGFQQSYMIQPRRTGDFVVRAIAADSYGNTFVFSAQFKVVPAVYAEITGLPQTAGVYEHLNVTVNPKNMTDETIYWKMSYITEEDAAPYLHYGLSNLWYVAKSWQEVDLNQVAECNLTNSGGGISFFSPGILLTYFCYRSV